MHIKLNTRVSSALLSLSQISSRVAPRLRFRLFSLSVQTLQTTAFPSVVPAQPRPRLLPFRHLFVRSARTSVLSYGSWRGDIFFHQPLPRHCNPRCMSACGGSMPLSTAGFAKVPDSNRDCHVIKAPETSAAMAGVATGRPVSQSNNWNWKNGKHGNTTEQ
jgi:hypothetical protein